MKINKRYSKFNGWHKSFKYEKGGLSQVVKEIHKSTRNSKQWEGDSRDVTTIWINLDYCVHLFDRWYLDNSASANLNMETRSLKKLITLQMGYS